MLRYVNDIGKGENGLLQKDKVYTHLGGIKAVWMGLGIVGINFWIRAQKLSCCP